MRHILGFLN
jgi:hypothetical protein